VGWVGAKDSPLSAVEFGLSDESELFGCSLSPAVASDRALANELIEISLFLVTRSRKRAWLAPVRTDNFIMVAMLSVIVVRRTMSNTIPSDGPDELDETETEMAFKLADLRFTSTCYNVLRKDGQLKVLLPKEVATKLTSLTGVSQVVDGYGYDLIEDEDLETHIVYKLVDVDEDEESGGFVFGDDRQGDESERLAEIES
jgi:hypothetical protein